MGTDAAELLERTADIIEERGHTQHLLEEGPGGKVCLMGGMNLAEHGQAAVWPSPTGERLRAEGALAAYLGTGVDPGADPWLGSYADALVWWNNEDGREQYEVIDACRHAAKVLRGG